MSKAQLVTALDTLNKLEARIKAGRPLFEPTMGICYNWKREGCPHAYLLVMHLSASWPMSQKPGRSNEFPIPGGLRITEDLWIDQGLTLRLDLIRHMKRRLQHLIRWSKEPAPQLFIDRSHRGDAGA
jgi:hypothetical protein